MAAENMAVILAYELIFGADERPQHLTKQKMQLVKLRKSDSSNERMVSFAHVCGAFIFFQSFSNFQVRRVQKNGEEI
jgi:hypothetical protein